MKQDLCVLPMQDLCVLPMHTSTLQVHVGRVMVFRLAEVVGTNYSMTPEAETSPMGTI